MTLKEELMTRYPSLTVCEKEIDEALSLMKETYYSGGTILVCGNGGSCSDSDHIVGELMKGFLLRRSLPNDECRKLEDISKDPDFGKNLQGAIPAISLTSQTAILSAFANDVDPDMVYAQLAFGYAKKNDLLIGLSTSGNSKNVVNAVIAAKYKGAKTLALTGKKESRLSALCDTAIKVPESETFKIQELHLPVYHYLCAALEETVFQ